MIKAIKKIQRPNVGIKWHIDPTLGIFSLEFKNHMKTKYIDTGKVTGMLYLVSKDKLEMTWTSIWISMEAYHEYSNDAILIPYWRIRDEYFSLHNIKSDPVYFEDI